MGIEEKIKDWDYQIQHAKKYGKSYSFSIETVEEMLKELKLMRTRYKNVITSITKAIEENRTLKE
ncbi:hypothetical protein ABWK22_01920 [Gottfriedia acidiceleris]|uniref:hypothetical protein n=1 Tax=Gottfriedia acidiceleris TaxID=371036 RepID=UPI00339A3E03